MKSLLIRTFSVMLLLVFSVGVSASDNGPVTTPAHYLIFTVDDRDEITLVSDQEVTLRGKLKGDGEDVSTRPQKRGKKSVVARVFDSAGKETFKKTLDVDQQLRAEYPNANGELRGVRIDQPVQTFVVRVPVTTDEDAVELELKKNGKKARFAFKKAKKAKFSVETNAVLLPESNSYWGDPANRLDLLVMGDGYTSAQSSKFTTDVNALTASFFAISPYQEYENFVNVSSLFAASSQAGADHPTCSDPSKVYDSLEPSFKNTAFDATYCYGGTQRTLTVDYTKVFTAAASAPDWDVIIVLVNDTMYGGSGGTIGVFSLNSQSIKIARHEFGHTYTGLADEYDYSGSYVQGCSDTGTPYLCEPNITDITTPAAIKWNPWILTTTPIPTPETSTYDALVGLFQGAAYDPTNYYRPKNHCLMEDLSFSFCEICKQSYVLQLHYNFEEIDSWTPTAGNLYTSPNAPVAFTATPLAPVGGPTPLKEWRVDGTLVSSGTTSYSYTPTVNGTYTVEFKTKDLTSLVNASMAGTHLQATTQWTVHVYQPAPPSNFTATGQSWGVAVTWTPVANATGYRIEKSTDNVNWSLAGSPAGADGSMSLTLAPGGYLIRIATIDEHGVTGTFTARDLAVVFAPSDENLAAGAFVRDEDINEVRTATESARLQFGVGVAPTYSSTPAANGAVLSQQILQTRDAVNALRSALLLTPYAFSANASVNAPVLRQSIIELRNAIR